MLYAPPGSRAGERETLETSLHKNSWTPQHVRLGRVRPPPLNAISRSACLGLVRCRHGREFVDRIPCDTTQTRNWIRQAAERWVARHIASPTLCRATVRACHSGDAAPSFGWVKEIGVNGTVFWTAEVKNPGTFPQLRSCDRGHTEGRN